MVVVDALYVADDEPIVRALLDALATHDVEVRAASMSAGGDVPLVVLITPAMLEPRHTDRIQAVAARYSEVLPVSFLPGAAPLFADLSQSLVTQLGVPECARRIALITTHGGRTIVDWNNLVGKAVAWRTDGQQALLSDTDASAALGLLQSAPAQSSHNRALVAEYVAASQSAVTRRRRIGTAVVSVSCAVLALILVFATVQAVNARKAQIQARNAGNTATANRLARAAIEDLGGNPDLPALLAGRALAFAETPIALEAKARVLAGSWPHQSYKLDFVPYGLSAATQSPRVAINDSDHNTIVVFDQPGGKRLGEFHFANDNRPVGAHVRLSPQGRRLIVALPNALKLYDVDAKEQVKGPAQWYRGGDTLIDWLDDGHLLIGRGQQVVAVVPHTGETTEIAGLDSPITSGSLSPNHQHLVVATERGVSVVDPVSKQVAGNVDGRIDSPIISDDGKSIVARQYPYTVSITPPDAGGTGESRGTQTQIPVAANALLPLDNGHTLALTTSGELSVISGAELYNTIRAHLSGRVRGARLPDGRVATVGEDGYLRVWSVPDFLSLLGKPTGAGFIAPRSRLPSSFGQSIAPRESARNQIRMASDDTIAVTLLPGYARVMSAPDLTGNKKWFFAGLDTDVFLSRSGSRIAHVGLNSIRSEQFSQTTKFWNGDHTVVMNGKHIQMAIARGGKGIGAVSDDGSTVVLADEYSVGARHADATANRDGQFAQDRRPVALYAESNGGGYALTEDGYLRTSDGTERKLDLPAGEAHAAAVGAAEFTGPDDYTLVTRDGRLMRGKGNSLAEIGNLGGGNDTFALRASAEGSLIALIGATGLIVYDTHARRVVYREPGYGTENHTLVTDVTFTKQSSVLYAVTVVGGVRRIEITDVSHDQLTPPRQFTADELALFQITEG